MTASTDPMPPSAEPRTHRDDPRWQEHQAAFVADHPGLSAEAQFWVQVRAAHGMYLIELEYSGSGRQPMSLADALQCAGPALIGEG
ncbi:hypothetical protein [Thermomonospora umbrina]|uniref:Uncharacterized protein n=1 Tax=Thermomonospora umbrina TaxID=111806 RepID=A0A3D9SWQ7_9ACTN|nr:hypothetical protein [Thermomonospora umbrina]REF00380.1 hypothetical protein DFJ69_5913 [Thermomonospora umbrina]